MLDRRSKCATKVFSHSDSQKSRRYHLSSCRSSISEKIVHKDLITRFVKGSRMVFSATKIRDPYGPTRMDSAVDEIENQVTSQQSSPDRPSHLYDCCQKRKLWFSIGVGHAMISTTALRLWPGGRHVGWSRLISLGDLSKLAIKKLSHAYLELLHKTTKSRGKIS